MAFNFVKVNCNVDIGKLITEMPSLLAKGVRCLVCLDRSARDELCEKVRGLIADQEDMENRVRMEENLKLRKRSPRVEEWQRQVDGFLQEVEALRGTCCYKLCCLRDCSCWYTDKLERITQLRSDRDGIIRDGDLVCQQPLETEVPNPRIVGREEILSAIGASIRDDHITVIGIYGIPGVGKTSLLYKLYHEHRAANGFDTVIYAVVSKDVNVLNLQKYIGDRLGLLNLAPTGEGSSATSQQTPQQQQLQTAQQQLCNELSRRNFILLLDDVWEPLNLNQIGIPSSHRDGVKRKIIFATPLRHVYELMPTDQGNREKVKVNFLSHDDSWTLFCQHKRKGVDDPSIAPAREVVESCGGLPRAVITVANALQDMSDDVCKRMVQRLKHSPNDIGGMEQNVLSPIRCAFNNLDQRIFRQLKQCLLYCSLFPDDHNIYIDQLIDYWVAEGLVGANGDLLLDDARSEGHLNIESLVNDCFLESCSDEDKEVRLHDMIRGMAVWITDGMSNGDEHCDTGLFLTHARLKGSAPQRWRKAKRISCMGSGQKEFPCLNIECPGLLTVLFNSYGIHLHNYCKSEVCGEPRYLFGYAKNIKVLDLSGTNIERIPAEVGSIGELQYLNLSYTNITSLPVELNRLVKLKQLILRGTSQLSVIPLDCIPTEPVLQMLDLFASAYNWSQCDHNQPGEGILPILRRKILNIGSRVSTTERNKTNLQLEHLSDWSHLCELGLTITSTSLLQEMVSFEAPFDKWPEFIVFLELDKLHDLDMHHMSLVFNGMERLRELSISHSSRLERLDISQKLVKLEVLILCSLDSLSVVNIDVTGTTHRLPRLRRLHISECSALAELRWVCQHPMNNICSLPRLREACLTNLPELCRVAGHPLCLPSLDILSVSLCPKFTEISWEPRTSAKIRGSKSWWDSLQWVHDQHIKSTLQGCFEEVQ